MPPVVGLIGAAAASIAATATALAGTAFLGSTVGAIVGRIAVGIGIAAITAALAPKPRVPKPSERLATTSAAITPMQIVYGRQRVAGTEIVRGWFDVEWWRNDTTDEVQLYPAGGGPASGWTRVQSRREARVAAYVLASHPIDEVAELYLDERLVTLNADGFVETAPMENYGWIKVYTGSAGQTYDPSLERLFTGWTTDFDVAGCAYMIVAAVKPRAERVQEVYPTGRAWIPTPVIRGWNEVFDPRDDSTGYSQNAALVIAHWLTEVWGLTVDWDEVATEANIAGQTVTERGGGSVVRWGIAAVMGRDLDYDQQRAILGAACDAHFFELGDGKVGFRVGRWIEPTVTLTPADFLSLEVSQGQGVAEAATQVDVEYVEPENGWRETRSAPYVIEAASLPNTDTLALPSVRSHNQALRIAKRRARQLRAELRVSGQITAMGFELLDQRFFQLEHPELGLDVAIETDRLVRDGPMLWTVEGRSVAAADFDFDAAEEEPERPPTGGTSYDVADPTAVLTGYSLTATSITQEGGTVARVLVSWGEPLPEDQRMRIRWRRFDESDWTFYTQGAGSDSAWLDLKEGLVWLIQMRAVTGVDGRPVSAWSPASPLTITPVVNSTPPGNILSAAATAVSASVAEITWVPRNEAAYAGVRIYRQDGAPPGGPYNIGDATLIATVYGAPGVQGSHLNGALPTGHYAYFVNAINGSGVETGPQVGAPATVDI